MAGIEQLEIHSKVCVLVPCIATVSFVVVTLLCGDRISLLRQLLTGRRRLLSGLHRAMGQGRCRAHDIVECPAAQEVNVATRLPS